MKCSNLNYYVFAILCFFVLSCSNEQDPAPGQEDLLSRPSATQSNKSNYQIAKAYSPIFYQDLDKTDGPCRNQSKSGSADWIAAVNYDGDWVGTNNWENLVRERSQGDVKAKVYYTTNETSTHFFVMYSVFHPRDWTDIPFACRLDSHENDMEGVLICAKKDGSNFGNVEYVSTIYHSERRNYRANEVLLSNKKAQIFIQAKGHGIRKHNGSRDLDGTYIKYVFGSSATQPSDVYPNTSKYTLGNLDYVWAQRNNSALFAGNSFRGDNGRDNAANAPWAWGDITNDPAKYVKNTFNLSNFSTSYVRTRPLR